MYIQNYIILYISTQTSFFIHHPPFKNYFQCHLWTQIMILFFLQMRNSSWICVLSFLQQTDMSILQTEILFYSSSLDTLMGPSSTSHLKETKSRGCVRSSGWFSSDRLDRMTGPDVLCGLCGGVMRPLLSAFSSSITRWSWSSLHSSLTEGSMSTSAAMLSFWYATREFGRLKNFKER